MAKISEVEENPNRRNILWDQVNQYLNEIYLEEDNATKASDNVMDNMTVHTLALAVLQAYLNSRTNHEVILSRSEWIRKHDVRELTNAYKPGWKQITPLAAQGVLVGISFGASILIPINGWTGGQAQISNAVSQVAQGGSNVASGTGQLMNTLQQGKQAQKNAMLSDDQNMRQSEEQIHQRQMQATQQNVEQAKKHEQLRFETIRTIIGSN